MPTNGKSMELEKVLEILQMRARYANDLKGLFESKTEKINVLVDMLNDAVEASITSIEENELKTLIFDKFFECCTIDSDSREKVRELFFEEKS